jgi:DNA-binding transcriptional MerR regulator
MAEYRIDELARLAGATVRNIRVYQDRGLLPPPRRDGRVGLYTDAHLARLRLIGQLLKRGYTFANIGELLSVWAHGGDIAEILDLESAVGRPWSDEIPAYVTAEQLAEMFGTEMWGAGAAGAGATGAGATAASTARAVELGLLEPDGERFRVPSPRLLNAGAELVAAGMPLPVVLDLTGRLRAQVDAVARDLAGTVTQHVLAGRLQDGLLQGQDIAAVAEITRRLRPLAQTAVDALLAQAMSQRVPEALGDHFARVLDHLERDSASAG